MSAGTTQTVSKENLLRLFVAGKRTDAATDEETIVDYSVQPANSTKPFRAVQDVDLLRTTNCNRVLDALKGSGRVVCAKLLILMFYTSDSLTSKVCVAAAME